MEAYSGTICSFLGTVEDTGREDTSQNFLICERPGFDYTRVVVIAITLLLHVLYT